jgi:hypothetical protein
MISYNEGIQIVTISTFFIIMGTSNHILWHAINKHEKKKFIIMKTF